MPAPATTSLAGTIAAAGRAHHRSASTQPSVFQFEPYPNHTTNGTNFRRTTLARGACDDSAVITCLVSTAPVSNTAVHLGDGSRAAAISVAGCHVDQQSGRDRASGGRRRTTQSTVRIRRLPLR